MNAKISEYLKKKGFESQKISDIPWLTQQSIMAEKSEVRRAFLLREGLFEVPGQPLDLTDDEYLLVRAAYIAYTYPSPTNPASEGRSAKIFATPEITSSIVIRTIVEIILLAIMGFVIGNCEYFAGEYSPDFRVDLMIQFWCYSAVIVLAADKVADRLHDMVWNIKHN